MFRQNLIIFINQLDTGDVEDLFKFYCSIRDSFNYLKKNIHNQDKIFKEKCAPTGQKAGGSAKTSELIKNETVLETISKYLTVRDEQKKLFGEVFTPVELVCEMLDQLPKEVWKNPKLNGLILQME